MKDSKDIHTAPVALLLPASASIERGSKQSPVLFAPGAQASASRVIRSCSAICPMPLTVPKHCTGGNTRNRHIATKASGWAKIFILLSILLVSLNQTFNGGSVENRTFKLDAPRRL